MGYVKLAEDISGNLGAPLGPLPKASQLAQELAQQPFSPYKAR